MLSWLKENTAKARQALADNVAQYRNRDFMEAVVAGCAIVAAADGSVTSEEKQKMMGFIQTSDELKVFKTDDVIKSFNDIIGKFDFDVTIGRGEALKKIAKIKSKEGAGQLLVRVCCAIGAADGDFDDDEKRAVAEICRELGLNPADFDLA
ncbi:MAG: tellurite resistance TerB family protein [Pseudomonadota bacterium]